jgi:hypothetical protein
MDDDKDIPALTSEQIDTIKLDDLFTNDVYIDSASMASSYNYNTINYPSSTIGNITISTTSGSNGTTWSSPWYTTGAVGSSGSNTTLSSGLHVKDNAVFEGDVKIKGVSILDTIKKIESRLAILRPDPAKLEHFEALKKAYEHYKTLEALCEIPQDTEEK